MSNSAVITMRSRDAFPIPRPWPFKVDSIIYGSWLVFGPAESDEICSIT